MNEIELADELLAKLEALDRAGESGPWMSMVEGRDHESGDDFILVGTDEDRSEDIYVQRDSGPAIAVDLDLIAAARTYLPVLLAEVRRLREDVESDG